MKMPLGTMVGLSPGNIVLDADPEGAQPPKFPPKSVVAKQLDGSRCCLVPWYEDSPRPRSHCYMGTQLPLPKVAQTPIFRPCLLWPNGRLSQLLLSTCSSVMWTMTSHSKSFGLVPGVYQTVVDIRRSFRHV